MKKVLGKRWRRCLSFGLVLSLMVQFVPYMALPTPIRESEPVKKLRPVRRIEAAGEKAYDDTNPNDLLSDRYITSPQLLEFLKGMLADYYDKQEAAVTIGDLMSYDADIVLTEDEDDIENVVGLGYARRAKLFDLSVLDGLKRIEAYEFYYCTMKEVKLPDNIELIDSFAFSTCTYLEEINLPQELITIREDAFSSCRNLNNVVLPDGIQTIAGQAFTNCRALKEIVIPDSVITMGRGVFMGCGSLTEVTLPDNLVDIPTEFLANTTSLVKMEFPPTLKTVGDNAFQDSGILTLDFSGTELNRIGDYAFTGTGGVSVKLPETLRSIGIAAFSGSGVSAIDLPEGLQTLGSRAFYRSGLRRITLPSTLDEIQDETFVLSEYLRQVTIQNAEGRKSELKTIGVRAFAGCSALPGTQFLKDLVNLEEIQDRAFEECSTRIYTENSTPQNPRYLRNIMGENYWVGNFEVVQLPSSLRTMGEAVFYNCYKLVKVDLWNTGVTELKKQTFMNCDELKSVILPQRLASIGESCFEGCGSLENIGWPMDEEGDPAETLSDIGRRAFFSCGKYRFASNQISGVDKAQEVIWTSVRTELLHDDNLLDDAYYLEAFSLEQRVFEDYGGIQVDYQHAVQKYIRLSDVEDGAFNRDSSEMVAYLALAKIMKPLEEGVATDGYTKVAVPMPYELYQLIGRLQQLQPVSSGFMEWYSEPEVYEEISSYNLSGGLALFLNHIEELEKEISTNQQMTLVADLIQLYNFCVNVYVYTYALEFDAFSSLDQLIEGFILDTDVFSYLDCPIDNVFPGIDWGSNPNIEEVNVAASGVVKNVGNYLTGLQEVEIPDSVLNLGEGVFESCLNLKEVTLPTQLEVVPKRAFFGCGARIRIPTSNNPIINSTTGLLDNGVGLHAYTGLQRVRFNDGLKEIQESAFEGCYSFNLSGGEIVDSVTTIGNRTFLGCSSLTKFVAPRNLTTIGDYAFSRASTVRPLRIGDDRMERSDRGYGLQEVVFEYVGSTLEGVGIHAFSFTSLETVDMAYNSSVEQIRDSTFDSCWHLEEFNSGSGVKYVGNLAFQHNSRLSYVRVPASAVLHHQMFFGYTNGTLNLISYNEDPDRTISIPLNGEVDLPINLVTNMTRNASGLQVRVMEGGDRIEYSPRTGVEAKTEPVDYNGYKADVDLVSIAGKELGPAKVEVACQLFFPTLKDIETGEFVGIITQPEVAYNLEVVAKPVESLRFEQPQYYLPVTNKNASLTLEALVEPMDTTEMFTWDDVGDDLIKLEPEMQESPIAGEEPKVLPKATVTLADFPVVGQQEVVLRAQSMTASCQVNVVQPATNITLEKSILSLFIGREDKVVATVTYATPPQQGLGDKITYTSSDEEVATVDDEGNVTAVGLGEATITVRALAANITRTCQVKVAPEDLKVYMTYGADNDYVSEIEQPIRIRGGVEEQFNIVKDPVDALTDVAYSLSDANVVAPRFNNVGVPQSSIILSPRRPGYTTLTVYPALLSSPPDDPDPDSLVEVEVVADATEINLVETLAALDVGKTVNAFLNVKSELLTSNTATRIEDVANVTSDSVEFSSSDPTVAEVDGNGVVTGKSAGSATITVTATHKYGGGTVEDSVDVNVKYPEATSIIINGPNTMRVGETVQYAYNLEPAEAVNVVKYSVTAGANVVSITEDGLATGLAKGTATIQAITDTGKAVRTMGITVSQPIVSVEWMKSPIDMFIGDSYSLQANRDYKSLPEGTTGDNITWTSNNVAVATVVASNGQIKAVGAGTTEIVGTTTTGVTTSVVVNVSTPLTGIKIEEAVVINVGGQRALTAVLDPPDANAGALAWTSTNPQVATVNEYGVITAVAKGECNIVAATTGAASRRSNPCKVTVALPSRSIKIWSTTAKWKAAYLVKGSSLMLKSNVTPSDTTDKVVWTSSKKKVATVSDTGVVSAKKKGKTTITAKTTSGKKASIKITVVKKATPAKKVKMAKKKTIKRNKTIRVNPKLKSTKSTDTVSWTSSNTAVASVDAYGNILGIKKGKATITVRTASGKTATCKLKVK